MAPQLQFFEDPRFGFVRVIKTNDEPLFCASDVCRALGYINSPDTVNKHVDPYDIVKRDIIDRLGRRQTGTFINESGLYALIFGSKLQSARDFKRWVTNEVLPAIRKHGAYMTPEAVERTLTDPDYLIKLATELKNEKAARKLAEQDAASKQKVIDKYQPKVDFYNAVTSSHDTIDIEEAAKVLNFPGIGKGNLFKILREQKILFGDRPRPYQKYIDSGYFRLIESKYIRNNETKISTKTVVYQKGLDFIRNVLTRYMEIKNGGTR